MTIVHDVISADPVLIARRRRMAKLMRDDPRFARSIAVAAFFLRDCVERLPPEMYDVFARGFARGAATRMTEDFAAAGIECENVDDTAVALAFAGLEVAATFPPTSGRAS